MGTEKVVHHAREHGETGDGEGTRLPCPEAHAEQQAQIVHVGLADSQRGQGTPAPARRLRRDAGLGGQHGERLGIARMAGLPKNMGSTVQMLQASLLLPAVQVFFLYGRDEACHRRGGECRTVPDGDDIQRLARGRGFLLQTQAYPAIQRQTVGRTGKDQIARTGQASADLLDEMAALWAHPLFAVFLRGGSGPHPAERTFAELPVGLMVHRQDSGKMLPEQRGEGAQLGLLKRIVEALETAGETLAQEIVGFQRQAGKGHAYRALELLQQPALHMDFQIIQYRAHRLGVRQQQDEAATGIHDAGRVGQLQPVQKMQPHGAGQRLQHEGPGPQQFARALVAAVGVGVLAKDELLDAAQIGAEQQEAFLPFGTVQPGLGDGRRSGRMVIERDIGPGAVCGGGDAPGESLQRGRQRVQIMPGPQMA